MSSGGIVAERKVKIEIEGKMDDGVEVPVRESSEKWSEYTLEDGTIIRAKLTIFSFIRLDGRYDADRNPVYGIKSTATTSVVSAPEQLRKKLQ